MMLDQIEAMTDGELRVECAVTLGWQDVSMESEGVDADGVHQYDLYGRPPGEHKMREYVPDYPRDIEAAFTLQDDIEHKGLGAFYAAVLIRGFTLPWHYVGALTWYVARATARQRAIAYLITTKVGPNNAP